MTDSRVVLGLSLAVLVACLGTLLFLGVAVEDQFGAVLLVGTLVPLMGLSPKRSALAVVGLLVTWVGVDAAMRKVPDLIEVAPSVTQAAGVAAYDRIDYVSYQLALALSIALGLAVGLAIVKLGPRLLRERGSKVDGVAVEERDATAEEEPASRRRRWLLIGGAALFVLTLAPDPGNHFAPMYQVYNWDEASIASWSGMVQEGLVPMRDFFYPYGFQWLYEVVPTGPVYEWLAEGATVALCGWSLWRIGGRRAIPVILCLFVLGPLGLWFGASFWRYLPGLAAALCFAALPPLRRTRPGLPHLVLGAACLLAGFLEADLLLYAGAGMLFVLVGELAVEGLGGRGWRRTALALAVDVSPLVAAGVLMLLIWVLTDTADGNLRFYLGARAFSAAAAVDPKQTVLLGYSLLPRVNAVELATPAMLAAAGLACRGLGEERLRRTAPILLAAAGVSAIFATKNLTRLIGGQSVLMALVALLWTAILLWRATALRVVATAAAFLATAFVMLQESDSVRQYWHEAAHSPSRAVKVASIPADADSLRRSAAARFSPVYFPSYPDTQVDAAFQEAVGPPPMPSFAVLGDAQLLYAFFHQRPPYNVNPYDASPIEEQRVDVERLEAERPEYLVWPNNGDYKDDVPYSVRAPLIYDYAVRHYVPYRGIGTTQILRRRRPGEPAAVGYWSEQLGPSVDLAFIPSLSAGVDAATCDGGSDCHRYVVLEGPSPESVEVLGATLAGPHGNFEVKLRTFPGQTRYAVRLDRLWFAPFLGRDPRVRSIIPGWTARVVGLRTGDELY